jgi:hypothetical protein
LIFYGENIDSTRSTPVILSEHERKRARVEESLPRRTPVASPFRPLLAKGGIENAIAFGTAGCPTLSPCFGEGWDSKIFLSS